MNATVSATNMKVIAVAGGDLLISEDSASSGFKATVDLGTNQTKKVSPVSASTTLGTDNAPLFYGLADKGTGMTADKYEAGTGATFAKESDNTNYWDDEVWVMSSGLDMTNLVATVEYKNLTEDVRDLHKSLRVMLVVTDPVANTTKAFIYTPVDGAATTNPIVADTTDSNVGVISTDTQTVSNKSTPIVTTLESEKVVHIGIYMWFEGQDANCMSSNAYSLKEVEISVTFSATDPNPDA